MHPLIGTPRQTTTWRHHHHTLLVVILCDIAKIIFLQKALPFEVHFSFPSQSYLDSFLPSTPEARNWHYLNFKRTNNAALTCRSEKSASQKKISPLRELWNCKTEDVHVDSHSCHSQASTRKLPLHRTNTWPASTGGVYPLADTLSPQPQWSATAKSSFNTEPQEFFTWSSICL